MSTANVWIQSDPLLKIIKCLENFVIIDNCDYNVEGDEKKRSREWQAAVKNYTIGWVMPTNITYKDDKAADFSDMLENSDTLVELPQVP